ncbi:hypothetical protein [Prevotella amnii]|jgi:hypothetical protein|nr:hypothetical protein [Prevotella amnii]
MAKLHEIKMSGKDIQGYSLAFVRLYYSKVSSDEDDKYKIFYNPVRQSNTYSCNIIDMPISKIYKPFEEKK